MVSNKAVTPPALHQVCTTEAAFVDGVQGNCDGCLSKDLGEGVLAMLSRETLKADPEVTLPRAVVIMWSALRP